MTSATGPIVGPAQGETVHLYDLGVRFLIDGAQTGGRFSLVEHPLPARSLGSPIHTHHDEDEYSFVLEGRFGVQLGDGVLEAGPGDLVLKPRGVPHAFWNAGDTPGRLLEIISPAGFEDYFRDLAPLLTGGPGGGRDEAAIGRLLERHHFEIDFATVPVLAARHGLRLGA